MSKTSNFKKTLIASAVASAMTGFSGATLAQEPMLEEVVVTGIRASLERSMDIRRDSRGVVDSIIAEDIGKMPDTNLAESLQRITGVAISREGGEGSQVTVRGMGPDFNLVTLNGRSIASTTGGRSFDFANIAAEMVTAVNVSKTSDARFFSGGMGATIDLQTLRPLDSPGMTALISGKGIYDSSSRDASVTPEIVGLFSNTFADDTIGVAVALSYQERDDGNRRSEVGTGWRIFDARQDQDWSGEGDAQPVWGGIPREGQVNRPDPTDLDESRTHYGVPQTITYVFTEEQRERLNGNLVLQWAPNENMTATFDYNRFERTVARQSNEASAWFTFAPSENVFNDGTVATPVIYTETYFGGDEAGTLCSDSPFRFTVERNGNLFCPEDFSMAAGNAASKWVTDAVGFNFEWQVNDQLHMEFDLAHSEASRTPDSPLGSNTGLSTAAFVRSSAAGDFTTDVPTLAVGGGNQVQPSDMVLTGSYFQNENEAQEITQVRIGGNFEFDQNHNIDFGVQFTDADNHRRYAEVSRNDWGGVGHFGDPDAFFTPASILDQFSGMGNFSDASRLDNGGVLADGTNLSEDRLDRFFMWDMVDGRADAIANLGVPAENLTAPTDYDTGGENVSGLDTEARGAQNRFTNEETTSLYGQYNYENDAGFRAQLGLRWEQTDVTSTSRLTAYDGAVWTADTEITLQSAGVTSLTETGSYNHFLPNLNVSYELTDNLIARAGYSKTIARGGFGDIMGGVNVGSGANQGGGSGSAGNPGLLPFESRNLDLGIEWYYGDASYVSLNYFSKDVTNFISTVVETEIGLFGLTNPAQGGIAQEARESVGGQGAAIRGYIFDNHAGDPNVNADARTISGGPGNDPMRFDITRPTNAGRDQVVEGVEFNVQHMFGETGFGAVFNYTVANARFSYDDSYCVEASDDNDMDICRVADQEAITGISDTMNIVGFYDRDGINVRLAYNWRDSYLQSRFREGPNPVYTDEFATLDLNASYQINDYWQVFFQGINILDEPNRQYGRDPQMTHNYVERGARWAAGARFTF
ncbi:TonB-dependent receptor [Marinimicrobium sp. ABcell2]|uniref:TonB-dependent receptor n=1 Tax=Marinimicrobium sp. ABcell2 TaxID=3069751 RepID=UPI0027B0F354|nr:TonB-dependent receptor [Marinimicrobium sp. ABcell2]MDQ2075876.1 TonB-dependent receptor [Marinimicrobium sp. ABcell2]